MAQTAVEFLLQKFTERLGNLWLEDFEQAKQMEREQIKEAYKSADECVWGSDKIAEEYYNETYGTTKQ